MKWPPFQGTTAKCPPPLPLPPRLHHKKSQETQKCTSLAWVLGRNDYRHIGIVVMVRGWSILLTATYYSVLLLSLLLLGLDRGALDVDHNAVVVRRTTGGTKSTEFIRSMECINTQVRVVQNHWCLRGRLWTGEGGSPLLHPGIGIFSFRLSLHQQAGAYRSFMHP